MGTDPRVEIRDTMMGYEVAVNGVTMAGPYSDKARARQAAKRLRREWDNRTNTLTGGLFDG